LEVFIYSYILIGVLTFENIFKFWMIDFWNYWFCMVLHTFQEYFTYTATSPLLVKGYKVFLMFNAYVVWSRRVFIVLICCDMEPRNLLSHVNNLHI
jgi:hypothetical protein